jgi:hypothetical protein
MALQVSYKNTSKSRFCWFIRPYVLVFGTIFTNVIAGLLQVIHQSQEFGCLSSTCLVFETILIDGIAGLSKVKVASGMKTCRLRLKGMSRRQSAADNHAQRSTLFLSMPLE